MKSHPILSHGLAAGAVVCVVIFGPIMLFGLRAEWMESGEVVGYGGMLLAMTATWFAMRAESRRRGAPLTWGQAFLIGAGVSLVAATLFGLATWLCYAIMGDALPQALYDFYTARAKGDPAKLAELEGMKSFLFNRPLQVALMFATVFPIGVVESLIGAWFISRPGRAVSKTTTA